MLLLKRLRYIMFFNTWIPNMDEFFNPDIETNEKGYKL